MIDIVATARKMGVYTIVVDKSAESVAKRFADKSYNVSTSDTDALVRIANDEKIDGVFTGFEDFNIHVAEQLAKRLTLPFYASREQLDVVTDKNRFKEYCVSCGVPTVEQYTESEALALGKYPYIIKPTDSYGSRGITVARCERELVSGAFKARRSSKTGGVIIERFIENDHGVELFYTAVNGNIRLSATADRYTVKTGETTVPLPVAEVFPSCVREKLILALDKKIKGMLAALGIKNGLVLIQALTDGEDFLVYEMAYRLTGEQHYRLVLRQRGYDLGKMMIKLALGEDISEYDTDAICD